MLWIVVDSRSELELGDRALRVRKVQSFVMS